MESLTPQLVLIRGDSPVLHAALGPHIGRVEIEREIGGPIRNSPGRIWAVAFADGEVAGFAGLDRELIRGARVAHIRSVYVLPQFRRRGVWRALSAMLVAAAGGASLRAVATAASLPEFLRHGLVEVRRNGRYHVMELAR